MSGAYNRKRETLVILVYLYVIELVPQAVP